MVHRCGPGPDRTPPYLAGALLFVKWAGVAYLLYLAYRMWAARAAGIRVDATPNDAGSRHLFLAGLAVTLGNPKVMAFFVALLPTLLDLERITLVEFAELAALMSAIQSVILTGYALRAGRARRFVASRQAVKLVNRTCSLGLAGAAAAGARQ